MDHRRSDLANWPLSLLPVLTSQVVPLVVELIGLQIADRLSELVIGVAIRVTALLSVRKCFLSLNRLLKTGRPKTPGRVYALTQDDAHASNAVVSGTLPVYSAYACVLFDSGATHSFISSAFVQKHALPTVVLDYDLSVATPVGDALVISKVCVNCPVVFDNHMLLADLYVMSMKDFDVILGMDWLSSTHVVVDCHRKRVDFRIPGETDFSFLGSASVSPARVISAL
ncbi:uncharacterized protein LOC120254039 [Dioscorea cayenensis subsp. rotundata]|uniref:Uncharacterized protein LOC120254039 n=1 Tax=Dioscorea cayennensis subsp. rotundata TaxID=55577 RepID=A0AB40AV22_DIOCR|nr:uncharacterized protein LOC120254039 [Dioscorea cayenensis subsp. rotundata]